MIGKEEQDRQLRQANHVAASCQPEERQPNDNNKNLDLLLCADFSFHFKLQFAEFRPVNICR